MKRFFKWLAIILAFLTADFALATDFEHTLIGGRHAGQGEYPEVVRIRSGRSSCSAAIVGERAILTAAHCTKEDGSISQLSEEIPYTYEINGVSFSAACKIHPLYRDKEEDLDMALCKSSAPMELEKYASITPKGEGPELGDRVILIGYGCTEPKDEEGNGGGSGGNDGILRVGSAGVTRLPNPLNNWFYATKQSSSQSALCFGDSGGPAFRYMRDPKRSDHVILGVNSRGNIRDLSLLTAIYLEKSYSWMREWSEENDALICGVTQDCTDGSGPDPQPDCEPLKEDMDEAEYKYIEYKNRYEDAGWWNKWYLKMKMKKYKKKYEKAQSAYEACMSETAIPGLSFFESEEIDPDLIQLPAPIEDDESEVLPWPPETEDLPPQV